MILVHFQVFRTFITIYFWNEGKFVVPTKCIAITCNENQQIGEIQFDQDYIIVSNA